MQIGLQAKPGAQQSLASDSLDLDARLLSAFYMPGQMQCG